MFDDETDALIIRLDQLVIQVLYGCPELLGAWLAFVQMFLPFPFPVVTDGLIYGLIQIIYSRISWVISFAGITFINQSSCFCREGIIYFGDSACRYIFFGSIFKGVAEENLSFVDTCN